MNHINKLQILYHIWFQQRCQWKDIDTLREIVTQGIQSSNMSLQHLKVLMWWIRQIKHWYWVHGYIIERERLQYWVRTPAKKNDGLSEQSI